MNWPGKPDQLSFPREDRADPVLKPVLETFLCISHRATIGSKISRRKIVGRKTENGVKGEPAPGKVQDLEALIGAVLGCTRKQKRLLLYKLFCNLLGKVPKEEVGIYDPQGVLYGYFLPLALREKLRLL